MKRTGCMMMMSASLLWSACATDVPADRQVDVPDAGPGVGGGPGDEGDTPGENPDEVPDDSTVPRDCSVTRSLSIEPLVAGTSVNRPVDAAQPDGARALTFLMRVYNELEPADGPVGDFLRLDLYQGHAGGEGFQTGSFALTGADTDITDCVQCVFFLGDTDVESGQPAQVLMAESGTLNITAVDGAAETGSFAGSFSNVTFREVTISGDAQTEVPNGCRTTLSEFEFQTSVVIE